MRRVDSGGLGGLRRLRRMWIKGMRIMKSLNLWVRDGRT